MQRVRRWIGSERVQPRRRRSEAGRVVVVLGAGTIAGLLLAATVGFKARRSGLQAIPYGLGQARGLFGRLIWKARRVVDDGRSVVLVDKDAGNGVHPKAPAAIGAEALTRV